MKVGITCYPTYGGSGVVATELGLELARRGHEIHFISYSQPIRLTGPEPNIHYHEVEVTRYPLFEYPPYDLALSTRMAEVSQLYELDLLHVHYAIPHSVSAMLAKQMLAATPPRRHLPFVTTLHGTDITLVGLDRSYFPLRVFPSSRATESRQFRNICATAPSKCSTSRTISRSFPTSSIATSTCANQSGWKNASSMFPTTNACWSICPTSAR